MKKRLHTHVTFCLLLMLGVSLVTEAQTRRFRGIKEAKSYTFNLPAIDKVELLYIGGQGEMWNGKINDSKTLAGSEAQGVAYLWRRLAYRSISPDCHNPAYGIRFYSQGKLLVFATVCYECDNIEFVIPQLERRQGFLGDSRTGQSLLRVFRSAFPQSADLRR